MKYVIEYELNEKQEKIEFEGEIRINIEKAFHEINFYEKYFNYGENEEGLEYIYKILSPLGKNYQIKMIKENKEYLIFSLPEIKKIKSSIQNSDDSVYPFENIFTIQW